MTIEREPLLLALSRATDARGLQPHELAIAVGADAKGRHRLRALLAELLTAGLIEKAEGGRYRLVGWRPIAAVSPIVGAGVVAGAATAPAAAGDAPRARTRRAASPTRGDRSGAAGPRMGLASHSGVVGRLRVHPAGYGFLQRDDGEDDVFVGARNRGGALDGDRVSLDTWMGFKGTEGRVADVLQRGRARITGVLRIAGRTAYLEADDPRIPGHVALDGGSEKAREGQCVVAEITEYPTEPDGALRARVSHVLGDLDDPRTEVAKVIACAEIPDAFPAAVEDAAARTAPVVQPEDLVDRVDLRDRPFLTIDPETARDFDDAVCVEEGPRPGMSRLWVAVADVSHYVRPGHALDAEARVRGVSVYLPDRAVPMLPHQLSAGICSLNPEVDRCAMVVRLDIDGAGNVVDERFEAAVIRSHARLDYAGVAAALAGDVRGTRARYEPHLPHLRRMQVLSHRLRALRHQRGSLDFDLPEAAVVLDQDDPKRVRDVRKSRSLPEVKEAYRIVEDFMLAANEAVARFFKGRDLPTLWRVHAPPSEERLAEFAALADSFGIPFSIEEGRSPRGMRDFLGRIVGKPMERSLSYLLLRALKQAVYDVANVGHFGLAAPEYLHFTSPIRRYPDLIVHRLLKAALRAEGLPAAGGMHGPAPELDELRRMAADASSYERRAMEAEREVVDMYRCFLMRDRVGEEYPGTIVGVTAFGVFVEISDPFVEGLVKVDQLGRGEDRPVFDEHTVRLVSPGSGRAYALGDQVTVRIENVSVKRRKIDMALIDHVASSAPVPMPRAAAPSSRGTRPRAGAPAAATPGRPRRAEEPGRGRTPKRRRR